MKASSAGVIALCNAPFMQRVTRLTLQGNEKVGDEVLPHLARLPKLKHLATSGTGISVKAAKAQPSLAISGLR